MFIIGILTETGRLFLEMAPYIMLGLLFVGLLNLFVSKDLIVRHIGSNNILSVFKAALFGVPLPLCSCGVVPSAIYFARSGASKGATISFLISTPQTGIDSIIATYGMLGWVFAVYRPLAALIMGIIGGIAVRIFDKDSVSTSEASPGIKFIETGKYSPKKSEPSASMFSKLKDMLRYSYMEFLDDIALQFIIGLLIAGSITYFIPEGFFSGSAVNNGIAGMALMILVGIPMYICATASIPIAVSLMMKGFSPGVAFVLLVTGPATNAASLTILANALGKKIIVLYLAVIIVFSVIFGLMLDYFIGILGIEPVLMLGHLQHESGMFGMELNIILGSIFLILLILSLNRNYLSKYIKRKGIPMTDTNNIQIEGMDCNHCAHIVKKAISGVSGVESVEVSINDSTAHVTGKFQMEEISKAVENAGYKVLA